MNIPLRHNQEGMTLLETVAALFVILIGIVAALVLIISSSSAARKTEDRLVAANLAREGIEIARSIRDTNWLQIEGGAAGGPHAWDDGLYSGTQYTAVPLFDDVTTYTWELKYGNYVTPAAETRIYSVDFNGGKLYNQYLTPPASGLTKYRRVLYTFPICLNDTGAEQLVGTGDSCALNGWKKIGVSVQAKVEWNDNGALFTHTDEARLYDWK